MAAESHASEAERCLLCACPASRSASTTCEVLTGCQTSERGPGHGRRVRKAADGNAFVSDVWRLAHLILLPCHSVGFCAAFQTKMQSREDFFKTPLGEVAEGHICLLNQTQFFHLKW